MRIGTINNHNFSFAYQIEGDGPTALVIGSSIYYPRLFSQNLRKHLRLVFTDMRAFAPPSQGELPLTFSLDLLLDDIEMIRQELELDKIIVIGHSGNAFLALEYAKKYPEHVSHVVMIGTSPDFSEESKKSADLYWQQNASEARKKALEKHFESRPDTEFEQVPLNKRFIWNYLRHTPRIWYEYSSDYSHLWEGVQVNAQVFDYVWGTLFRDIDITDNLECFNTPVFLALGRHDYIVAPPDSWDPLKSKFKDISMHIFEKSGHSPFYEEAELFDDVLLKWLAPRINK